MKRLTMFMKLAKIKEWAISCAETITMGSMSRGCDCPCRTRELDKREIKKALHGTVEPRGEPWE